MSRIRWIAILGLLGGLAACGGSDDSVINNSNEENTAKSYEDDETPTKDDRLQSPISRKATLIQTPVTATMNIHQMLESIADAHTNQIKNSLGGSLLSNPEAYQQGFIQRIAGGLDLQSSVSFSKDEITACTSMIKLSSDETNLAMAHAEQPALPAPCQVLLKKAAGTMLFK